MAIRRCTCEHAFQDAKYGKGKRVCNAMKRSASTDRVELYRCTVCGNEVGTKFR